MRTRQRFRFQIQIFRLKMQRISNLFYARYMTSPSHCPWFYHTLTILYLVKKTKLRYLCYSLHLPVISSLSQVQIVYSVTCIQSHITECSNPLRSCTVQSPAHFSWCNSCKYRATANYVGDCINVLVRKWA